MYFLVRNQLPITALWCSEGPQQPVLERPSMLTFSWCGRQENLGKIWGSSCDLHISPFSGADHLLLRLTALSALDVYVFSAWLFRFTSVWGFMPPFSERVNTFLWLEVSTSVPSTLFSTLDVILCPFLRSSIWVGLSSMGPLFLAAFKGLLCFITDSEKLFFFWMLFFRLLRVREIQTSPTESLAQDSASNWVVRSGQQDDQPWPNTKKGYSTRTSTHT